MVQIVVSISSEHLNGSGLHLNRHGKGKLAMNLIKNSDNCVEKALIEIGNKEDHLVRPRYCVLKCVCNNDCKRKSDTAGPKHLLKIKHAIISADFQDRANQMKTLHEMRIKNASRLIGHLNISSFWNKFEMLEETIKDKIDIFLISETKLDSYFPSGQFVIKGQNTFQNTLQIRYI